MVIKTVVGLVIGLAVTSLDGAGAATEESPSDRIHVSNGISVLIYFLVVATTIVLLLDQCQSLTI
jgi:large-conductance mechanosensitive channel